ncbi:MAG: glycerol-3-phosphate acyltransferase [Anaerolineae bacterium]|nr:glycerol-3-phosphate acyltransferase [Anaerolineae bacterium]
MFLALLILAYLSGAFPWSVWLGVLFFQTDVRTVADGNPGAANAFRVGGWRLGISVLLLDFFKAFIPVSIARWVLDFSGEQLLWIALMPSLGHAFSIFLGFRGGRALTSFFGVWSGLTLYEIPLVMGGAAIAASLTIKNDILRTFVVPAALFAYLILRGKPFWMLILALMQLLILLAKISVFLLLPQSKPSLDQPVEHKI